jgi:hypothetical protein
MTHCVLSRVSKSCRVWTYSWTQVLLGSSTLWFATTPGPAVVFVRVTDGSPERW